MLGGLSSHSRGITLAATVKASAMGSPTSGGAGGMLRSLITRQASKNSAFLPVFQAINLLLNWRRALDARLKGTPE